MFTTHGKQEACSMQVYPAHLLRALEPWDGRARGVLLRCSRELRIAAGYEKKRCRSPRPSLTPVYSRPSVSHISWAAYPERMLGGVSLRVASPVAATTPTTSDSNPIQRHLVMRFSISSVLLLAAVSLAAPLFSAPEGRSLIARGVSDEDAARFKPNPDELAPEPTGNAKVDSKRRYDFLRGLRRLVSRPTAVYTRNERGLQFDMVHRRANPMIRSGMNMPGRRPRIGMV